MGGWRAAKTEVSQVFAVRCVLAGSEPTTTIITFSLFIRISHPGTSSSIRTADLWKCFTPAGGATSDLRGFWRSLLSKTSRWKLFIQLWVTVVPQLLNSKTTKPSKWVSSGTKEWSGILYSQNDLKLKSNAKATKLFPTTLVSHSTTFILKVLETFKGYGQKRQRLSAFSCEVSLQLFLFRLRGNLMKIEIYKKHTPAE